MTNPTIRDLAQLIAFPTVSNRPIDALASFVAERMEGLGFRIERFAHPTDPQRYNVVASIGPSTGNGLVLSGHMDVVPTEGQPWNSDPFTLTEKDGKLIGRGTADMKGFIAATLSALNNIDLSKLQHEIVCVWTYDEEIGCLGSAHLATLFDAAGRRLPEACLIGEPTNFEILRMHPGHTTVAIRTTGQAAHSSRPDLGHNAINDAAKIVVALEEFAKLLERDQDFHDYFERPWVAFNTGMVGGGSAVNIVPDACVIRAGFRPLPGMTGAAITKRLDAFLRDRLDLSFTLEPVSDTPPMLCPSETALEHTLCAHASNNKAGAASFATDGGNLALVGCKPLIFGPGSIEVAHKADEFILGQDLLNAIPIIESVIRSHCH